MSDIASTLSNLLGRFLIFSILFFGLAPSMSLPAAFAYPAAQGGNGKDASEVPILSSSPGFTAKDKATFYFVLGLEHLRDDRLGQALEAFTEGAGFDDGAARFPLYRGYVLLRLGKVDEAEKALDQALRMEEGNVDALRFLGYIHYESGRIRSAAELWRRALAVRSDDSEIKALLAKVERDLRVEEGMSSSYGSNFVVSYDGKAAPDLGEEVLEVLESALLEVGALLATYPNGQIPVVLYTREEFNAVTGSPDWAGGSYDGRVRLPIGGMEELRGSVRAVIYHEYTHVIIRQLTGGNCPRWLNEGLAEWMGRQQHDPGLPRLSEAAVDGRLLTWDRLEPSWDSLAGEQAQLAYEQSYSVVDYLLREYDWATMTAFLRALGGGVAVSEAFERFYGESLDSLERRWRLSVSAQQSKGY